MTRSTRYARASRGPGGQPPARGSMSAHGSSSSAGGSPGVGRRLRVGAFGLVVAASLAGVLLLWPRGAEVGQADQRIELTMGGFSRNVITARAGTPARVQLVNPDSPFHTDGGGWHQLAIPALGLDFRVAPRSQQVVEIPAAPPGEYAFYCDICCGGKQNPTMQGVLRVQA